MRYAWRDRFNSDSLVCTIEEQSHDWRCMPLSDFRKRLILLIFLAREYTRGDPAFFEAFLGDVREFSACSPGDQEWSVELHPWFFQEQQDLLEWAAAEPEYERFMDAFALSADTKYIDVDPCSERWDRADKPRRMLLLDRSIPFIVYKRDTADGLIYMIAEANVFSIRTRSTVKYLCVPVAYPALLRKSVSNLLEEQSVLFQLLRKLQAEGEECLGKTICVWLLDSCLTDIAAALLQSRVFVSYEISIAELARRQLLFHQLTYTKHHGLWKNAESISFGDMERCFTLMDRTRPLLAKYSNVFSPNMLAFYSASGEVLAGLRAPQLPNEPASPSTDFELDVFEHADKEEAMGARSRTHNWADESGLE